MAPQRVVLKFFLNFSYDEELTVSLNKFMIYQAVDQGK